MCTPDAVVLLVLLPFLNQIKTAWPYSCAPLHFIARGWPLYQLGLQHSLAFLLRIPMNATIVRLGDWLCAPLATLSAATAIGMVLAPDDYMWVAIGLIGGSACDLKQAHASLCPGTG